MNYDVETIKNLVKLAQEREADEVVGFLLDFLETLVPSQEFAKFLPEIGQGD